MTCPVRARSEAELNRCIEDYAEACSAEGDVGGIYSTPRLDSAREECCESLDKVVRHIQEHSAKPNTQPEKAA